MKNNTTKLALTAVTSIALALGTHAYAESPNRGPEEELEAADAPAEETEEVTVEVEEPASESESSGDESEMTDEEKAEE